MGVVIVLEEKVKERLKEKCLPHFDKLYENAGKVAEEYTELMAENPGLAIEKLSDFIRGARDVNPESSFVEAVAGGPNQDWTAPILDILGTVYPSLDMESREKGLRKSLYFLDHLNYFNAQDNVELINEPWLAGDIVINRPLYWCGYNEYCNLLSNNQTWDNLLDKIENPRSMFWLTLAVTRPKYSSLEVRKNYYSEFPDMLDKTLDAIAGLASEHARHANETEGTKIEDYVKKSLSKYDPLLHERIREKMKEKKWIVLEDSF